MPYYLYYPTVPITEHAFITGIILRGDASIVLDGYNLSQEAPQATNQYWGFWAKLNESLDIELSGKITSPGAYAYPTDIIPLEDGSFFLCGLYFGNVNIHSANGSSGPTISSNSSLTEAFVGYFSSMGILQWARRIGRGASELLPTAGGISGTISSIHGVKSGRNGAAFFISCYGENYGEPHNPHYFAVESQLIGGDAEHIATFPAVNETISVAIARFDIDGFQTTRKKVKLTYSDSSGGFPRFNFIEAFRATSKNGKIAVGISATQLDAFDITFGSGEANERTFTWNISVGTNRAYNYIAVFDEETLEVQWVSAIRFKSAGITIVAKAYPYECSILDDGYVAVQISYGDSADVRGPTIFFKDNLGSSSVFLPLLSGTTRPTEMHALFASNGDPVWVKSQLSTTISSIGYSTAVIPNTNDIIYMGETYSGVGSGNSINFDENGIVVSLSTDNSAASTYSHFIIRDSTNGSIVDFKETKRSAGWNVEDGGLSFHQIAAKDKLIWMIDSYSRTRTLILGSGEANETTLPATTLPSGVVAVYDTDMSLITAKNVPESVYGISTANAVLEMYNIRLSRTNRNVPAPDPDDRPFSIPPSSYWRFQNISTNIIRDDAADDETDTPEGRPMEITTGLSNISVSSDGFIDNCIEFNGNSTQITVPDIFSDSTGTLIFWIKFPAGAFSSHTVRLIWRTYASFLDTGVELGLTKDTDVDHARLSLPDIIFGTPPLSDVLEPDTWYMVSYVKIGSTIKMYLNDQVWLDEPTSLGTEGTLYISSTPFPFYGKMAEGAYWTQVLTDDEIIEVYNRWLTGRTLFQN